ncbi:MAG: cytosine/adenosine deaminase-related metal-dependent hydrolase, partial [Natronomonas sp.]
MTDTLLTNGRIVTQNDRREIIEDGAVAITDDRITAVGTAKELEATHDADRVIDAEGCAVVPGLVGPHIHVSDILLRGAFAEDLGLYEWLFDVRQPVLSAMTPADHELAARLYCVEAIQSGMTAFVENDLSLDWHDLAPTRRKLAAYDEMGVRNIYGAGIRDQRAGEAFEQLFETVTGDGDRDPYPLVVETAEAFDGVESLIESRHDPDGRQSVWPAPATLGTTTAEALRRAYDLAETHDVMTTTHVAQAETEEEGALSSIEYLRNIGYLGDRALLGHCVQTDDRDVRILAETGTAVAHNFRANMLTATGFAPAVEMLDRGVPVGAGTDNPILNDT